MKEEGHGENDEKDGVWTFWDKEGNVTKTETYKDGELVK
jgi:antitoxin component YwqK of YwqJK toxin-antitoxin module